jgi:hypothetical protein
MKKLLLAIVLLFSLVSCNNTTLSEDMQMLQKKYPKSIVYRIDEEQYIIVDSINIYDVRVTNDGKEFTKIKIK